MFIKSIVIDGFKSYAKRTEITGFDPAFNAITGLNGSGKSNILDAICFLLGITNLSQVRASNLQDLIYKGGQAGVVKATVSIVFDNRQKAESPIGYETYDELTITRQIVMGGKNKYLINGNNVPNNRVHDLFRSVQLNVNNPHFLIMQGRITKVLNMKPPEILSLLEEAAATKLYESKRESTLSTIEKKESKLREIEKLLREDISPKLAKLREERDSYMIYQNISREIEYLNKFIIACKYVNLKVIVENSGGQLARMKEQRSNEEKIVIKCNENLTQLEGDIELMSETRRNELLPKFEVLDKKFSDLQKREAVLNNAVKRAEETLKSVKDSLKKSEKEKLSYAESSKKIQLKVAKIQSQYDGLQNKMKSDKLRLDKAQQKLQEVNSGLFSNESGAEIASLSDILSAAVKTESHLNMELTELNMHIKHLEKEISNLTVKMRGLHKDDSVEKQQNNHRQLKSKESQIETEISSLQFIPDQYTILSDAIVKTKQDIRNLESQRNPLLNNNRWLKFEYSQPYPNFDHNLVKGVVASLIQVENGDFNVALQTAAGSRLYNIIVENDEVAAQLIKGCMNERKTLLPLNKMQAEPVPDHLFRAAENLVGKGNVWQVLSLVKFDESYRSAMTYVFGRCLIARNLDMARKIAFSDNIRCRAVTLEGDVFDPEGTLLGGSNDHFYDIIGTAIKYGQINESLKIMTQNLRNIENELNDVKVIEEKFTRLSRERDDIKNRIHQLELKMRQNNYLEVEKNLSENKLELQQLKEKLDAKKSEHDQAKKRTKEAKENVTNSASIKEKAQKAAEHEVVVSKQELEKSENDFNSIELEYDALTSELKSIDDDRNQIDTSIDNIHADIGSKEKDVEKENDTLQIHRENMTIAEQEVKEQKKCLNKMDSDINKKREEMKKLIEVKEKAESNLEDINHTIEQHHEDSAAALDRLLKMERKNAWIVDEKINFGKKDSMYDFETNNLRSAETKVEKLLEQKQKLSSKVDMRGMDMLGQMETKYEEVNRKYHQVLLDKTKLQDVIDDLDKRKDEVLKKAHEQVDRDFDKMFSTLLPGSRARLMPPEGKTLKEGLEFRICFGNVWKESLTELSGGQRSLVALSLILALLLFKPAPLYILDEVDAALDISHTQNIGTIIKEQFSNSQFVIVSLKDGMFNNANVLYKTKFVDGVSTVSRHVNQARRPMTERNG